MKNIEWLKETLGVSIKNHKSFPNKTEWNEGYIMGLIDYKDLVDKLDEPEVLSDKWIDEREQMVVLMNKGRDDFGNVYSAGTMVKGVPSGKLQNLLVPKQEEVDQAYKDGYENGKQHATEKQSEETETVAGVLVDYLIASAKLKLALSMEVEELEE